MSHSVSENNNETNSLWPMYSLLATFVQRFGLIVLAGLVVFSAVIITSQTHELRLETAKYNQLKDQQVALDLEWQKLSLEQSALSEHSRIEALAESRLKMKHLDKETEVVIENNQAKGFNKQ